MTQQRSTVVGVFTDRVHADQAVSELRNAGFREDQIGVAMRHTDGGADATTGEEGSHAGSGAVTGMLTGLGLGALAGLGVLSGVIPVIGPAIAAGTLGVILSNAAAGQVYGTVIFRDEASVVENLGQMFGDPCIEVRTMSSRIFNSGTMHSGNNAIFYLRLIL